MDEIVRFVVSYPVVSVVLVLAFGMILVEIGFWMAGFNDGYHFRWSNIAIILVLYGIAFTLYINQLIIAYILIAIFVGLTYIAIKQNTVSSSDN